MFDLITLVVAIGWGLVTEKEIGSFKNHFAYVRTNVHSYLVS